MSFLNKATLLAVAIVLAACSNPRGGADDYDYGQGSGINSTALGDPSDPASIAYFNQTIGDTVHFTLNSTDLSEQGQVILRTQAVWLNRNPQYSILIEGHADERGTREYNVALGARRAARVEQFLIGQGVAASRLRTVSYGKERPVEACAQQRCWDLNRRAVVVVSN
ncbi:peptidoglycan-associated lipoprotein Pal [Pararhodobacter oceanensis]|uniref:Peptidoglycan-associated lipoprotein n=1 Tax=Pararhodobacter oceanensis TaxID=2172121 RepID=A0A2T8HUB2_9RHOB|nr:peptidoglycan-associated lipoprotein Pal [Pararhodobacter oceanensis]PVH29039.1 peptidoglycan-associated lipoprotein Pal [Pararhodobacter oceanensis]